MEILALIATIIGGIVAAIQLFKWVRKLKISSETQIEKRPFVDIQVTYHGGESIPRGISPKAKRNPNQEYFIADETLHVFQLTRKIRVNLVNNSDQAAFYPKLFVHKNSPVPDFKNLNSIIPIKPHASIVVEGDYTVWMEAIPTERVRREES